MDHHNNKRSYQADQNASSGSDHQKRKKVYEAYSLSKGYRRQPCEQPYECEKNVNLTFNYWRKNDFILTNEISKVILHFISSGKLPLPEFMKTPIEEIKSVVVVAAHGISPLDLGKELNELSFFTDCTSVPVRHTRVTPSPGVWRHMDMEPMSSLMFWDLKETTPTPLALSKGLLKLFENYRLSFQVGPFF